MNADNQSRRWLSQERGTVTKDWGGRISVALIFPNKYYVGMSGLGFQTLYNIFNSYEEIVCERAFMDSGGKSVESGRPLDDFSVLAFSISSEMDYFNTIEILADSGIPLSHAERDDSSPLVIAGGPCIIANPEPLAPFLDACAIGEGEALLPALTDAVTDNIEKGRDSLLEAISKLPGMYVPPLHNGEPVVRQWARDIDGFATTSAVLTPNTEFSDMYLIEIARGCRWGCRFCLAGYLFRPFRHRSTQNILQQAREALKQTSRIGLLGACISDHPEIDDLASQLRAMGANISASSLRVRPLSVNLLHALKESGTDTVTLAPEAASERLRRIINKNVNEDDITAAVIKVGESGIRRIKLYFMIGLPGETDDDAEEIVKLATGLKQAAERKRAGTHLIVNIEPFVPKAGTAFQRLAMADGKTLGRRMSRIRRELERKGIEVRGESIAWAGVQGVLSRGDRSLAPALIKVSRERTLAAWRQSVAALPASGEFYPGGEMPSNARLPWGFIDHGVKPEYLESELDRAMSGRITPPCPTVECHKCGVC